MRFPGTHNLKSLRFCWYSFPWLGREGIAIYLAYHGRPKFLSNRLQPIWGVIFHDAFKKNRWRSVDPHFVTALSTICNHLIWHSPSFTLFWLPFWRFHLLSTWSLRCSWIIHRYIPYQLQECHVFRSTLVISGRIAQSSALVFKMHVGRIIT
jgi:hypothetical protein